MASTTIPGTSKDVLQQRVSAGYRGLRSALEALPRPRLEEPTAAGWSLKAVVAHLAAWEETVPPRVASVLAGQGDPKLDDDIDAFNARVTADADREPADELFTRWGAAHERLLDVVRSLPEAADRLAYDIVEWNTTGHYPDHYAELGAAIHEKGDLFAVVQQPWVQFRIAIGSLGLPTLERRTSVGWTYKDLAAHAAAWEDRTASRLRTFCESGAKTFPGIEDSDDFNALVVERTRGRDARDVLRDLDEAHARLVAELEQLTPEQLHANDDWVIAIVAGNTYGHYAEHHDELFAAVPLRPAVLLEKMREGWRPFRRALGRAGLCPLSETASAGWTYKGMLGHLAYWMEKVPGELPVRLEGRRGPLLGVDEQNARAAEASAARSAQEVVDRFDAAYKGVVDAVTALPPDRDIDFMAVRLIAGETYVHFAEHGRELEAIVPRTVGEVLARFDETWRRFRGAIRGHGRAGLAETTSSGWRYRDLVAHAAAWMQQAATELRSGEIKTWDAESIQRANDRAVRSHELVGAEALLDELDTACRRVREQIAALPAERLSDAKVYGVVAFYNYLHWEEHFAELGIAV